MQGRRAVQCRVFTSACCLAVLSVLADRAVAQQAVSQPSAALTAMDYIEIQQLVNRLNFALDYCTNGGRAFADLFVEGGQFIIDQGDGKTTVRRTRNELIALAGGPDCTSRKSPPSSDTRTSPKASSSSRPPTAPADAVRDLPGEQGALLQRRDGRPARHLSRRIRQDLGGLAFSIAGGMRSTRMRRADSAFHRGASCSRRRISSTASGLSRRTPAPPVLPPPVGAGAAGPALGLGGTTPSASANTAG